MIISTILKSRSPAAQFLAVNGERHEMSTTCGKTDMKSKGEFPCLTATHVLLWKRLRQTDRYRNKLTDRPIDMYAKRQTYSKIDRWTERHIQAHQQTNR